MARKIIHVVLGKANPDRMNGVNRVVNSLATTQTKLGYNVELWGITKTLINNYPERNYSTRLFQDHSFKFKLDPTLKTAVQELDQSATIFHLHGGYLPQFYSLAHTLVKAKVDYLYTPHGAFNLVAMQRSALKKKVYNLLFENFIVQHAKTIHCIGKSELHGTTRTFGKVPQILIPNGQSLNDAPTDIDRKKQSIIFGFVGRLDEHTKGLDILIKGFELFATTCKIESKLWLIGNGPDAEKLKSKVYQLGLENHVEFKGALYGEEKINAIRQMDYLCLSSRNEGLPGVVLEAAGLGIPVIVSRPTNMADYIRRYNAGEILQTNSASKMMHSMYNALQYKLAGKWNQLSKNAQTMVRQSFNWELIAKKLIQEYEK